MDRRRDPKEFGVKIAQERTSYKYLTARSKILATKRGQATRVKRVRGKHGELSK